MFSIRLSGPQDSAHLLAIWRDAVAATHHFLDPADFSAIERLVVNEYLPVAQLHLAIDEGGHPLGFMGLSGTHVDSLFVAPRHHGRGIGRALLAHALGDGIELTVDVNEQNGSGAGFYERLGFIVTGRSPTDDSGRPYSLLHMRLSIEGARALRAARGRR